MNDRLRKSRPVPQPIPETIDFARGRWAASTRTNYKLWWDAFSGWCRVHGHPALPTNANVLTEYLQYRAGDLMVASLTQVISAIKSVHDLVGYEIRLKGTVFPDAWAQIKRDKGTRQTPKTPLMGAEVAKVIPLIDSPRDRALLMLTFGLALRRSEVVALDVEDLSFSPEGVRVAIRRSKTDQEGKGVVLRMPRTGASLCPVAALEAWIESAGITAGALFLSHSGKRLGAEVVALLAKRAAKLLGKDHRTHSGHSLRRGFVTTAFEKGAPIDSVKEVTRHSGIDMLLKYKEHSNLYDNPAQKAVWGI